MNAANLSFVSPDLIELSLFATVTGLNMLLPDEVGALKNTGLVSCLSGAVLLDSPILVDYKADLLSVFDGAELFVGFISKVLPVFEDSFLRPAPKVFVAVALALALCA